MSEQLQLSNSAQKGKPETLPSSAFRSIISSLISRNTEMSAQGNIGEYSVKGVQLTKQRERGDHVVKPTYVWLATRNDQPSTKYYGLVLPKIIPGVNNSTYSREEDTIFTRHYTTRRGPAARSITHPDQELGAYEYQLQDKQNGAAVPTRR